jgi:hypothetical protein
MPEPLSAAEVLSRLVERVRLVEREAGKIAAVLDNMIERLRHRRAVEPTTSGHPPP